METNLKMRREKYFPGIHKFEKLLRWLWSQFRSSCSDLEWKKPTTVNSQHVQEGYESFHMAVSDLEDTFHGLYIFRTRSQGLTALVSVSDGKIQITILILRRGPCLILPWPAGRHFALTSWGTYCPGDILPWHFLANPAQCLSVMVEGGVSSDLWKWFKLWNFGYLVVYWAYMYHVPTFLRFGASPILT